MQEDDRNRILDVSVFRGLGGGISDHHLVVAKLRCLGGGLMKTEESYEIEVSEFYKVRCKIEYEGKLKQKWERIREEVVGGM